jgi:hypothetical protein
VLLVPLIRPEKGTLLDTFNVTDASGTSIATISHTRVRGLMAYVLTALVKMATREPGRLAALRDPDKIVNDVLGNLILAVCSPGPLAKQPPARQAELRAAIAAIDNLPITDDWRERIKLFCLQFIDFYVVVAEAAMPAATNHLVLRYTHRVPCESSTGERLNRWRIRLGLAPTVVDLPLNAYAFQVPSALTTYLAGVGGQAAAGSVGWCVTLGRPQRRCCSLRMRARSRR